MFALRSVIVVLSDPEIIKLFSCSTQLSMNFPQLIKTETLNNIDISLALKLSDVVFILLILVKMSTIVGNLTIMRRKSHAQLS